MDLAEHHMYAQEEDFNAVVGDFEHAVEAVRIEPASVHEPADVKAEVWTSRSKELWDARYKNVHGMAFTAIRFASTTDAV